MYIYIHICLHECVKYFNINTHSSSIYKYRQIHIDIQNIEKSIHIKERACG